VRDLIVRLAAAEDILAGTTAAIRTLGMHSLQNSTPYSIGSRSSLKQHRSFISESVGHSCITSHIPCFTGSTMTESLCSDVFITGGTLDVGYLVADA
jgi:hypothetical protein